MSNRLPLLTPVLKHFVGSLAIRLNKPRQSCSSLSFNTHVLLFLLQMFHICRMQIYTFLVFLIDDDYVMNEQYKTIDCVQLGPDQHDRNNCYTTNRSSHQASHQCAYSSARFFNECKMMKQTCQMCWIGKQQFVCVIVSCLNAKEFFTVNQSNYPNAEIESSLAV